MQNCAIDFFSIKSRKDTNQILNFASIVSVSLLYNDQSLMITVISMIYKFAANSLLA